MYPLVVQSVPMANAHVQDVRFLHILPALRGTQDHASPFSRTGSATAADTTGPGTMTGWRGPARATAGTHPAFPSRQSPCTASSARGGGGGYRQNWVRNALAASLNRIPGVQAVLEPMVMTRQAPGDQRRGDIKVIKSGTSWILDVGIICPGSQRLVNKGADTIPGKAAAIYDGKKTKTHSDQANFVPFIVETGRTNTAGLHFLSRILPLRPRARLDLRGGMDAAFNGHWRSTGLHTCTDCRGDTCA
jgi:hypothetical protein